MEPRYVPVAEIARPHGVQGELRLRLFNERSDLLHGRPPLRLRLPDGAEREARIEGARPTNGALLIRLAGVTDRDAAEALRGATVCVPRDAFPPAEEGEFYACDVEGAQVVTASGEVIGRVRGISSYPSCDALVVELVAARPTVIEIPLTESYVASVDVERRTVAIVTLEGLL